MDEDFGKYVKACADVYTSRKEKDSDKRMKILSLLYIELCCVY
ncbi:hypothetical protein LCGC14_1743460 [marine sediment metagenome]|uniref:Uncharacterized protein n=1 Tax=marine sediment metagenome TaxID=412755 RepID=A0A0F9HTM5_9ZZZZ